jgi:ABC-type multidrug transport system permease subunit
MPFILMAADKDLRRLGRDWLALALWVGIPLIIGGLLCLVMGGIDNKPPIARVLVVDQDGDRLGWLLSRAFGEAGSSQPFHVEEVSEEEGRARMNRGDGTALLIIPKSFLADVLNDRPATLQVITNPAQNILPRMVVESLEIVSDGAFYAQRIAGTQIHELAKGPPPGRRAFPSGDIARISAAFNQVVERMNKYLAPPVIRVETKSLAEKTAPRVSTAELFLPGILFMALVFMAEGMSADLWRERDQGTLRRAISAPCSLRSVLGGKLLAAAALLLACSLLILIIGMGYLGLAFIRLPLLLAWAVATGLTFLLFFYMVQIHVSSQRAGSVLGSSIAMPLLFVGGNFFPFEMMPAWMATLGKWTPNGWALIQFKDILYGRADAGSITLALAGVVVLGLVLFLVAERRLRKRFAPQ